MPTANPNDPVVLNSAGIRVGKMNLRAEILRAVRQQIEAGSNPPNPDEVLAIVHARAAQLAEHQRPDPKSISRDYYANSICYFKRHGDLPELAAYSTPYQAGPNHNCRPPTNGMIVPESGAESVCSIVRAVKDLLAACDYDLAAAVKYLSELAPLLT